MNYNQLKYECKVEELKVFKGWDFSYLMVGGKIKSYHRIIKNNKSLFKV
ncbi:hypothetical protein [Clostridium sp.]|nr:hypothetical protein [Clostridium sp.]